MIDYTVRKSLKARRMRITVHKDARVVVTIPKRADALDAKRFVNEKKKWIEEKVMQMKKRMEKSALWNIPKGTKKGLEENKEKALALVHERLAHFNQHYGFGWKKITIKNLSSRWGSSSKLGNLNFSYKIVYLPEKLADYLVVHELCHLKELNHSARFWKLVEKTIPNCKEVRKELRGIE
jgi:predicted metal-dependent hydrolase